MMCVGVQCFGVQQEIIVYWIGQFDFGEFVGECVGDVDVYVVQFF